MFEYVRNRRVLLTGHTGFCGSWLAMWLKELGADVYGLSKPPITDPNLFDTLGLFDDAHSFIGDIAEPGVVSRAMRAAEPEIVFHLAAQPLVRQSYADPLETYRSNVIGTAELLQAIHQQESVRAAVLVTTDKVYHNREWIHPYREDDRLGGKDPYSASKAACELVISSYTDAVLDADRVLVASARGGNIIGGGDWSADRLIPDIVRAVAADRPLIIRNPAATRPWQHVLALCHGYLALGERLAAGDMAAQGGWNFGPVDGAVVTTLEMVDAFAAHWVRPPVEIRGVPEHEAQQLALDSTKARRLIGWTPAWGTEGGIEKTVSWYRAHREGADMRAFTLAQIDEYRMQLEPDARPSKLAAAS